MAEPVLPPPPPPPSQQAPPPPPPPPKRSEQATQPPKDLGFIDYLKNAYERGVASGAQADILAVGGAGEDADDFASLAATQKRIRQAPASDAYQRFTQAKGLGESLDAFLSDPLTVLGELTVESGTALARHGISRVPLSAAIGAGGGTVVPGIGTAAGATVGGIVGLGKTSLDLEYSGSILESLQENGVDVTNPEALQTAFSDDDQMEVIRASALRKGVPVAIFDMVSGGLAGKIAKKPAKTVMTKAANWVKELGVQSGLGMAGETTGQLAQKGEIESIGAILAEGLGELGVAPIEVAAGSAVRAKQAATQLATQLDPALVQVQDQIANEVTNAVQEQTIGQVPVQSEATSGQEVSQAQPQAESQAATQEEVKPRYTVRGELGEVTEQIPQGVELQTNQRDFIQNADNARIAAEGRGRIQVPRTKVTVDEMAALKSQIRLEARAAREGVKAANTAKAEVTGAITNVIEGLRLPAAKQATIIRRIGRTDLMKPVQVARLLNYVEKVADDVVYADKIQQAETLQSRIKGALSSYTPQQQTAIKQFTAIKPEDVSSVDEYITVADKILAPRQQVEGENYAALRTQEVQDYLGREVPRIEQFLSANMEPLPTDAEIEAEGPTVSVKLGQMAQQRIDELSGVVGGNTRIAKNIQQELRGIDLSKMNPKQMRDFVRKVDNILVNEDYGGAAQVAAEIYALNNAPKIEAPAADVFNNAFLGATTSQLSTWLNRIYGNDNKAAQFQADSNINNVFGAASEVEGLRTKFLERWKKTVPLKYFSHDQHVLLSQFAELMQYEEGTDPQAGFDLAKANIEQGLTDGRTYQWEDIDTEEKMWKELSALSTPQQAENYIKTKHPNLYKQWQFLVKEFEAISDDLSENKEAMYGEKFVKVKNYIPYRNLTLQDKTLVNEDEAEVNRWLGEYAIKPKAAPTTITRVQRLPEGQIRDRRLLSVVEDRYEKSLLDIYVSFEALKAAKTLNAIQPTLAKSGIIPAYNERIKKLRGAPEVLTDAEQLVSKILSATTEIAYTTALGGLFTGILQYGTAMLNTLSDLSMSGRDPSLFFRQLGDSKQLHDKYTIGQRLSQMGGLSEVRQANLRVKVAYGKGINKFFNAYEWVKSRVSPYVMASQVYSDYFGARQAWNAFYLSKLKEQGVNIKNIDWKDEASRQNEPERKLAAAFAEQKVGVLLAESSVAKRSPMLSSNKVAPRLLKVVFLPFATYMWNYKQRMVNAAGKLYGKDAATGVKEMAVLMTEAAAVAMVLRPLTAALQGQVTEVIRDWFDYPEDEEDKEKRDKMAAKFRVQNLLKDLMPWAVNNQLGDATLELFNRIAFAIDSESDQTFQEWYDEKLDAEKPPIAPFVVYEQPFVQQLGMIGIVIEQISGVKEAIDLTFADEDTLIVTDRYGNEVEVELDERTKKVLEFHGLLSMLSMAGVNIREVKAASRQMRQQAIKENK